MITTLRQRQYNQHLDEMIACLEGQLHFDIAVNERTGLFVHAGVVGWTPRPSLSRYSPLHLLQSEAGVTPSVATAASGGTLRPDPASD